MMEIYCLLGQLQPLKIVIIPFLLLISILKSTNSVLWVGLKQIELFFPVLGRLK